MFIFFATRERRKILINKTNKDTVTMALKSTNRPALHVGGNWKFGWKAPFQIKEDSLINTGL